jgi:hypothetical protein
MHESPPTNELQYATAAMSGATTLFHQDPEGFLTTTQVLTGAKLWTVATRHRSIPPNDLTGDLSSIHAYGPDWGPEETGRTRGLNSQDPRFEFESVLLQPGSIL